jgi:hypothetical protein
VSAGVLLGFDSGGAALHVDNLAVPESDDHGIPSSESSLGISQLRRADDLVVTDAGERQILNRPAASCVQDLTGLVWAASGGCVLPPEVSLGWAAPLGVFREQGHERLRVAAIQSLGCSTKLVDHGRSMAQSDENGRVPLVRVLPWRRRRSPPTQSLEADDWRCHRIFPKQSGTVTGGDNFVALQVIHGPVSLSSTPSSPDGRR